MTPETLNPVTQELMGKAHVRTQATLLGIIDVSARIIPPRIDRIAKQGALGIDQGQQRYHNEASLEQRKRYQQEEKLSLETWITDTDSWLNKQRTDAAHPDKAVFLKEILGEDTGAKEFFDKYLGETSNVIAFINDIETKATREQIVQHADIIRNLGNAFGYKASKSIEHMIYGIKNNDTPRAPQRLCPWFLSLYKCA